MPAAFAQPDFEAAPWIEVAAFVLSLRARGISDLRLLRAMETVRREVFAPRRYADLARQDIALPLPCGETMTSPTTVAAMLASLRLEPGLRVLEIGTGSGYVTALLASLGGHVLSLERKEVLFDSARQRLRAAGIETCQIVCCDGLADSAVEGRFDRVLVNGAFQAGQVPAVVTSRLAPGGRLVAGSWADGATQLIVIDRDEAGELAVSQGATVRLSRFS